MNRSYSKKRHIQEANDRLEKRFLNEDDYSQLGAVAGLAALGSTGAAVGAKKLAKQIEKRDWGSNQLTNLPQKSKSFLVGDLTGKEHSDNSNTIITKIWDVRESTTNKGSVTFSIRAQMHDSGGYHTGTLNYDCKLGDDDFKWLDGLNWNKDGKVTASTTYPYSDSSTPWHTNPELANYIKEKGWCTGAGANAAEGAIAKGAKSVAKSIKSYSWNENCAGTESNPFKKGCKSETIKKVQGCLDITQDGKFGSGTQRAIQGKINKTTFTTADIDKLCDGTSTNTGGGGTPALTTATTTLPQQEVELTQF